MVKLASIERYKELSRTMRKNFKNLFSNLYYMPKELQRYIEMERAYIQEWEQGFWLVLDEGNYYRVCVCADWSCELQLPLLDKKAVFKYAFREGKNEECPTHIEDFLRENGFVKEGTVFQVKIDAAVWCEKAYQLEGYVEKLERNGFYCKEIPYANYGEVEQLFYSTGLIRDYQIDYRTEEEKQNLPQGTYLGVYDNADNLCGAGVLYLEGKVSYSEGVAIVEEYKMQGLAPMLMYYRAKWIEHHNIEQMVGWILTENKASWRYQKSCGGRKTGKLVDEWVRQVSE